MLETMTGDIQTASGVVIPQSREVGGHFHHMFNRPRPDGVVSQSCHKLYIPHTKHVLCEDEVLIGKVLDALRIISLPHAAMYTN